MNINILLPLSTSESLQELRARVSTARTFLVGDRIIDRLTGEYYGSYTRTPFPPSTAQYESATSPPTKRLWRIADDGTPSPLEEAQDKLHHLAPVVELVLPQALEQDEGKLDRGRKPQAIENPLAAALYILKLEGRPTSWMDDIAFGAINTGPGLVSGRHSVSLADVKKLLLLPELSVATAAGCLLNYDRQPMSTRQLQRVVVAARTALRGIALYLERHPDILRSIELDVDFETFWNARDQQIAQAAQAEHPKKRQALAMVKAGTPIKTTARQLGISKNTVKKWQLEAQGVGGQELEGSIAAR